MPRRQISWKIHARGRPSIVGQIRKPTMLGAEANDAAADDDDAAAAAAADSGGFDSDYYW